MKLTKILFTPAFFKASLIVTHGLLAPQTTFSLRRKLKCNGLKESSLGRRVFGKYKPLAITWHCASYGQFAT